MFPKSEDIGSFQEKPGINDYDILEVVAIG